MSTIKSPSSPQRHRVDLEPIGRRVEIEAGQTLLDAARMAGVDLVAACGGIGICGTCLVRLVDGCLSACSLSEEETLGPERMAQGYRLACQAQPLGDVRIEVPAESLLTPQRMLLEGAERPIDIDPAVQVQEVHLAPPSLEDLRSDLTRVNQALMANGYPALQGSLAQLAAVSDCLRSNHWTARLVVRPQPEATQLVTTLETGQALLGLAVDMGSTKLALYLVDLENGTTLASQGVMNPQIAYGEDVVSRIAFANQSGENRRLLQVRLVEAINQAVEEMCTQEGVSPRQIAEAALVGNTAIHHLFCGLPVEQLGAAPYVAAVSEPLNVRAAEVGLELAPGAAMYLPANIAGYVGADHIAALVATQVYRPGKTRVLVDIGTNTEISLIHQGNIYTCSTASGPAFEGAHITDGMRAAPGAIEAVRITPAGVQASTIGGLPPVGICGTGILSAVSELLVAGIMDRRGVFLKENTRVRAAVNGGAEFLLVPADQSGHGREIVITRKDVHEIQLAKGAIRAGIEVLLREANLAAGAVEEWVIAGAFGTYLDLQSALRVGMFPQAPLERFHQVGNAAGVGAKHLLLSRGKRTEAEDILKQVHYIELTVDPQFTQSFFDAMYFDA
ncbi:MAG: DUF4445 domain-containing protein [Chloroflexi bacterium]|nr:DUF4445 domain-containing protein [Chloroflexota bacterium]